MAVTAKEKAEYYLKHGNLTPGCDFNAICVATITAIDLVSELKDSLKVHYNEITDMAGNCPCLRCVELVTEAEKFLT